MFAPPYMFPQTVQIEKFLGMTGRGESYSAPITVKCSVELKKKLVRDKNGNQVNSEGKILFPPEADVTDESRVTYDGKKYTVFESDPHLAPLTNRLVLTEAILK